MPLVAKLIVLKKIDIVPEVSNNPVELVFIRAPYISEAGKDVRIIHKVENKIVAARQKNILVTSFHPELTDDLNFHNYFIKMVN
ncbi:hypothetical protein TCEA9_16790 [Thermobrachium celere]|nr:hypothetical protein TCEA9_16790 [Thermobrachium celere]